MNKSTTGRITIIDPEVEGLERVLADRDLAPGLITFLKDFLKKKKWARKINIPSGYNDVAAVLVFASTLKKRGLEIFNELHVYFAGKVMVEKWRVVGETDRISLLPKEVFRAIHINKVRVEGTQVTVEYNVPMAGGQSSDTLATTFDFSGEAPAVRIAPHPLGDRKPPDRGV